MLRSGHLWTVLEATKEATPEINCIWGDWRDSMCEPDRPAGDQKILAARGQH